MRNPKWHRDEILLALELYFRTDPGAMHARNSDIIELSEVLNKLPIHTYRPDQDKFRNPNGVGLKLNNFKAIDPDYSGAGMQSYSRLDEEIFWEFYQDRDRLNSIASRIRRIVHIEDLNDELFELPNTEIEEEEGVKEGKVILKLHKYRERNSKLIRRKKESIINREGKLVCEVCGFDFHEIYGEMGNGFIECHHKVPLSIINENTKTKLADLALVCANYHRMLHKRIDVLSIKDLQQVISNKFENVN